MLVFVYMLLGNTVILKVIFFIALVVVNDAEKK